MKFAIVLSSFFISFTSHATVYWFEAAANKIAEHPSVVSAKLAYPGVRNVGFDLRLRSNPSESIRVHVSYGWGMFPVYAHHTEQGKQKVLIPFKDKRWEFETGEVGTTAQKHCEELYRSFNCIFCNDGPLRSNLNNDGTLVVKSSAANEKYIHAQMKFLKTNYPAWPIKDAYLKFSTYRNSRRHINAVENIVRPIVENELEF